MHIPRHKCQLTPLAKRNTTQCEQSFQNRNQKYLARRETQFNKSSFPPIRRHSNKISKTRYTKIASVLFASNNYEIRLPNSPSNNCSQIKRNSDINYINKNKYNMPSKKRITRVCFSDSSSTTNPTPTPSTSSRAAN